MDVEIKKKDGSTYRLSDYGVVYDFVVHSITIDNYTERIEGRSGFVDYGADYGSRRITVPMKFKHLDMHGYAHVRDELYGVLTDIESYHIREMRRPKRLEYEFVDFGQEPKFKKQTENRYVGGKQYLVRMVSEISPEQMYNGGEIEIEFETTELPFAETMYTTLDLSESGLDDAKSVYGLSDNINDELSVYRFTENEFTIWNGGNVPITPENMYLNIAVKELRGVTNGDFTIENTTTKDKFMYLRSFSSANDLVLDGVMVTLSGLNRLAGSNREFITIAPGENKFKISGGTFKEISFDFKYVYK